MIALAAAALTLAIWTYLLLGRGMFWQLSPGVSANAASARPAARVAIVIPARNEAAHIGRAVASLAAQQYSAPFHIFVADDHSEDGTAGAASCAPPEILTVLKARPLPGGWTGKLWAVSEALYAAETFRPDYVLLTDADVVHPPDNLATLVSAAEAGSHGLVSLMVRLRCETFAEKALIPAFVFFFFMLYPPEWIADPHRRTAGAAGGCMLVRWDALCSIGGIAAIRGDLIDDCAFAKALKRAGSSVSLGVSHTSVSTRAYGSFREIGRMISRTAFWQLRHSAWLLAATVTGMLATYALPPLLVAAAPSKAASMAAVAWGLMCAVYVPALRFHRRALLWAPFLPLVALFYTGATIHSALSYWYGRGGIWKGRTQDRRRS